VSGNARNAVRTAKMGNGVRFKEYLLPFCSEVVNCGLTMRLAIISDIHGNLPALEAVLKNIEASGADIIHCLGDTVGYGPYPDECVTLVRDRCTVALKGNHDSGLLLETPLEDFNMYGMKAILWSRKEVAASNQAFLRDLPFTAVQDTCTFAHASPLQPDIWRYVLTLRAAQENFSAFTTDVCFIGHTHVPVIIGEDGSINRMKNKGRYIINVGSVGQPRDHNPDAAYGLYDTESRMYQLVRVPYDIQITMQAIREAGLPEFLAHRLSLGI
jgi:diadenosine tetraphosphatase ApaH/serine/threonine PP2A family protein phosphatase